MSVPLQAFASPPSREQKEWLMEERKRLEELEEQAAMWELVELIRQEPMKELGEVKARVETRVMLVQKSLMARMMWLDEEGRLKVALHETGGHLQWNPETAKAIEGLLRWALSAPEPVRKRAEDMFVWKDSLDLKKQLLGDEGFARWEKGQLNQDRSESEGSVKSGAKPRL